MFAFLGGGIVTFIGSIIKFFNAGDVLNFYDEKIHDKNKVSKIVGNDIFYTGLGIILIAIIIITIIEYIFYKFVLIWYSKMEKLSIMLKKYENLLI